MDIDNKFWQWGIDKGYFEKDGWGHVGLPNGDDGIKELDRVDRVALIGYLLEYIKDPINDIKLIAAEWDQLIHVFTQGTINDLFEWMVDHINNKDMK